MLKYTIDNKYKDLDSYKKDLNKIVKLVEKKLKLKSKYFFEVSIVDKKKITEINKNYRNKDKDTDVISFAFNDAKENISELLGEIFICYEKILEQAKEYNHSIRREYSFLFVHGLLHLLGYDHIKEEDEKIMFELQEDILNKLNIKRG